MSGPLPDRWLKRLKSMAQSVMDLGINPLRFPAIRFLPRYIHDVRSFKRKGGAIDYHAMILSDYTDQAGTARGHYFHQDLLVASFIHKANPARHVDIGSRIDGFIAHVASFRPIEVMDVRALEQKTHPNIAFLRADLMDPQNAISESTDSLSCLHAIEHFGLGRYGDPIDPQGHITGFNNMIRMLKPGGTFYISFPIGTKTEVFFNAHRVFHPKDILSWPRDAGALRLARFDYVDDAGDLHQNADIERINPKVRFGCGIYTFIKQ